MLRLRALFTLGTAAMLAAGCAHFGGTSETDAGNVLDPVDAAKTVVLHVENLNPSSLELRAIVNGRSQFVGSVPATDTTSLLLDPSLFPTATLYVTAITSSGRRAIAGPLAASRGDRVIFTVQPALDLSSAVVRR